MTVDEEHMGRVEFELVDELLPKTCANFRLLCERERRVDNPVLVSFSSKK